jgi:hypothetical protein
VTTDGGMGNRAYLSPTQWRNWENGGPAVSSPSSPAHAFPHSGWISAVVVVRTNTAVAVLMLLVALLFTGIAVLGIVMLKRVRGRVEGGARRVRSWVPRVGVEHSEGTWACHSEGLILS